MRLVPPKGEAAKGRSNPSLGWNGFSFQVAGAAERLRAYEHDERDKRDGRTAERRGALAKLAKGLCGRRDAGRACALARGRVERDAASERHDGREPTCARL